MRLDDQISSVQRHSVRCQLRTGTISVTQWLSRNFCFSAQLFSSAGRCRCDNTNYLTVGGSASSLELQRLVHPLPVFETSLQRL